jgi:hypothetical protein
MCYEATIASAGGDEATLAKSLIITLEDTTANWYSRLFLAAVERQVSPQLPGVPSRA